MGLHINKNRDNLKEEVIEINEQSDIPNIDFGFYYYDLHRKNYLDQKHLDALIDYQSHLNTLNDMTL